MAEKGIFPLLLPQLSVLKHLLSQVDVVEMKSGQQGSAWSMWTAGQVSKSTLPGDVTGDVTFMVFTVIASLHCRNGPRGAVLWNFSTNFYILILTNIPTSPATFLPSCSNSEHNSQPSHGTMFSKGNNAYKTFL